MDAKAAIRRWGLRLGFAGVIAALLFMVWQLRQTQRRDAPARGAAATTSGATAAPEPPGGRPAGAGPAPRAAGEDPAAPVNPDSNHGRGGGPVGPGAPAPAADPGPPPEPALDTGAPRVALADVVAGAAARIRQEVAACGTGASDEEAHDRRLIVHYFVVVKDQVLRIEQVDVVANSLGDPKIERCMLDAVAAVTYEAPNVPDTRSPDQQILSISGIGPPQ